MKKFIAVIAALGFAFTVAACNPVANGDRAVKNAEDAAKHSEQTN